MQKTRVRRFGAMLVGLSLVAAACGGDDDGDTAEAPADEPAAAEEAPAEGKTEILVTGPERSEEQAGALQEVLGAWGEANGVEVTYLGSADWEAEINTQVEGGNPPDISIFPQPGKLADFARAGHLVPIADFALAENDWSDAWNVFGVVDGVTYGVPVKSDMKSLVWYKPATFAEAGYEVPTTFADFLALVDTMANDGSGTKPLCVGIESGQATGWTYTDWVEEMVLRQHGAEVYDGWVSHEIPFSDPRIMESMQAVVDLWTEDNVYAASGTIAATAFGDNGIPLVEGDCYMHRQASFFSGFIPEGTVFGPEGVDVFYFPDINGDAPVLGAGTLAAAFNADPNVHALLGYMSSAEYAEARQQAQQALKGGSPALSGFLSAAQGQDLSVYEPLEQSILNALASAGIVRFDASDLMPADVGAGTFWTEGTSLVNGDITVAEAAAAIDASWPGEGGGTTAGTGGAADETLVFGGLLPETGNLAFLGPPEFAGLELAVAEANMLAEQYGIAGVEYLPGDSGDNGDVANATVDRLLAEDVDVFIGAASSGVSLTVIDKITQAGKVQFSPANTSPVFTTYDDNGLYFRTAPSDVVQGAALADMMINDGAATAVFLVLNDSYGTGLLEYSSGPYQDAGGEVLAEIIYDPQAENFDAEIAEAVTADADAIVIIGFDETSKILTGLIEAGQGPADKLIYGTDGNMGNALAAAFDDPTVVAGMKGTLPGVDVAGELPEFRDRLLEVDPSLTDFSYAAETYDAVMVVTIANLMSGSTGDPAVFAPLINDVTRGGTKCASLLECGLLLQSGVTDIDYDGVSGPLEFNDAGEPTEASILILEFDATGALGVIGSISGKVS
ncbi:MAG: extracellular solute-binding protein [Ilumatobacteraceae bacterium]|nr:extracellular solute-binding protein [Ilumatobacteraceae bacterium]